MNDGNFNSSFADTGQWRLIVNISSGGIGAFLKNLDYRENPVVTLFNKEWEPGKDVLSNIESAVYDNPRILDDFATHIILTAPRSLWIPSELTEDEEFDETYYSSVYPTASEDIHADFGQREVCLYSLIPGLNSFLRRTLPGSKISSHLSVLKSKIESSGMSEAGRNMLFVNLSSGRIDVFLYSEGHFISGASHSCVDTGDLVYFVLLTVHAYGIKPGEASVTFFCESDSSGFLLKTFSEFFPEIAVMCPEKRDYKNMLPVPVALAAGDNLQYCRIDEDN